MTVVLEAKNLSRSFGHVDALVDVSFDLHAGEILAVLGDNGAGKSTLIKILSGLYNADRGEIIVEGTARKFGKPADAVSAGIATVYQDLALVDTRDVAANLYLGREFRRGPFVDRRRGLREARKVVDELGIKLPSVKVPVGMLSGGQRQAVAVARTIVHGATIVIMDEPTAALGVTESARVIRLACELRDQGKAVMIISHNLEQIWTVADRFLVMRLGRLAGIRERASTQIEEIVQLIVYGSEAAQAQVSG
jgi:ABC-type sugar transport system ATPase subunit